INYLHDHGPQFKHLDRPSHLPLRKEYACYLQWVTENVSADVDYGQGVTRIALGDPDADSDARLVEVATASGRVYRGRSIVVAPERSPYVPPVFTAVPSPLAFHTSRERERLAADRVLLATGYRDLGVRGRTVNALPRLSDLAEVLRTDASTPLSVDGNYGIEPDSTAHGVPPIYINSLCDSTHRL